ncbi:WD repeat protein [Ichthyophthirius multifiliis]|uniref:WD repeat protein n=1 Tax=Ichthyophthirius multifiliis TaxID=5932 RepID=G0QJ01_ICHMU|nr:WD repeat protein [Ichthyophthirius multifiliis]EGR34794.1 WD repeat protein [Ichthyophthirius multifiliis]|eukprot:XP_004040098.1 WD repeat protein [Ichthyophthirius multifiliis]
MQTSAQQIQLKHIFGISSSTIQINVQFQDNIHIIYQAGNNIVLYDLTDKSQKFYQSLLTYNQITCFSISPLKRYLALGVQQESLGHTGILIYDTLTQKLIKQLNNTELDNINIKQWTNIVFPTQGQERKYLISTSGGGGDAILSWWNHDKMQCVQYINLGIQQEIQQIKTFDQNANIISLIGKNYLQLYEKKETFLDNFQQYSLIFLKDLIQFQDEIQDKNFLFHFYIKNFLILICENSQIYIANQNFEDENYQKNIKFELLNDSPLFLSKKKQNKILSYAQFNSGFFLACQNLQIFEYQLKQNTFNCINKISVNKIIDNSIEAEISSLDINLEQSKLIFALDNKQIYEILIQKGDNILFCKNKPIINLIIHNTHFRNINGIDICYRKPIIATCGQDKTLKIWDYENKVLDNLYNFNEEPLSVALNPQGIYAVVSFTDKLKLINLNINTQNSKNNSFKEISPFKSCRLIQFSNGGQYFAAVNIFSQNHIIQIFNFYTGEGPPHLTLKGHTGRVKSIAWSSDDTKIASCGLDGMIYAWNLDKDAYYLLNGVPKLIEIHYKGVNFYSISITNDNKQIIACGSDKKIHLIQMNQNLIIEKVEKKDVGININSLKFTNTNKLLFAGISDENQFSGILRIFSFPLSRGNYNDYNAHDIKGVENILITKDDKYIISQGKDSCIMLFEVKDQNAKELKYRDCYHNFSEDILVNKCDLDELKTTKDQLILQLQEIKNQSFQASFASKDDHIIHLEQHIQQEQIQMKNNIDQQQGQVKNLDAQYANEINLLQENMENDIQNIDNDFQKQIMTLVEQYEHQKRLLEIEISQNQKHKEKLIQQNNIKIQELQDNYLKKIEEQKIQKEIVEKEIQKLEKEQKEVLDQIIYEKDSEIENLSEKNKKDENILTEQSLKVKSEISITKKKIMQQQDECQELKDQKSEYEKQKEKLKNLNAELKDKIDIQRKLLFERDNIISDKEKNILKLKKKVQDLEKFKFVLDYKIKDLKKDIMPRQQEIELMKVEILNMDEKLKSLNKYNNYLGTVVDELYTTQEAMKVEIQYQRNIIYKQETKISRFKDDVYRVTQNILNKYELENEIENMYKKYIKVEAKKNVIEDNIVKEYKYQKQNLQNLISMFKKSLEKDKQINKEDKIRQMTNNVQLIKEINQLRKNIKELQKQNIVNSSENSTPQPKTKKKNDSLPQISQSVTKLNDPTQIIKNEIFQQRIQYYKTLQQEVLELKKVEESVQIERQNIMNQ